MFEREAPLHQSLDRPGGPDLGGARGGFRAPLLLEPRVAWFVPVHSAARPHGARPASWRRPHRAQYEKRNPALNMRPTGLNSTLLPLPLAPGKAGGSVLKRLSMPT